jgi:NADPH:quinone reductase-like Zn-dependent oxidoreductase
MEAFICKTYDPPEVLKLTEVEKNLPKDNEVLFKIHATTINAADCNVRGLSYIPPGLGFLAKMMLGFKKPKISITGYVPAGEAEAGGKKVKFGGGANCEKNDNLQFLCKLIENGKLKPVPDRTIPFDDLVEAHRCTETCSKHDNVAVHII